MKLGRLTAFALLWGMCFCASWAVAQSNTLAMMADEPAARADEAAPPAAEPAGNDAAYGAGSGGGGRSCNRGCQCGELGDPWTIPQLCCLKDNGVTVGGWLEGGIYSNQYGAASNGPIGFRNVGDGFTMDQIWVFGERKTDTKGCGWDAGGRIDYLFGADGPDSQAFGDRTWDYGWNSARDYGSAIPQAYFEIAFNDLDDQGRAVLHADRLRGRARHAELLLLALVQHVLRRTVHPHRRVGQLQAATIG